MPEDNEQKGEGLAILEMTKEEALKARDDINNAAGTYHATQRARVLEFYLRKGWTALGYKTWGDCMEKEFSHARTRVYQLLDEGQIERELAGSMTGAAGAITLSGRALLALKAIPEGRRAEVLEHARVEHGTETPSGAQVASTAKAWEPSIATETTTETETSDDPSPAKKRAAKKAAKKAAKELTIGEEAADNEKLHQALIVIGTTCTRPFRKAIEEGTIEMSKADVMKLSELEDEKMQEVEKLLSVYRDWKLSRALKFLDKMPELSDPVQMIHDLAIGSLDDTWTGDFGAGHCVYTINRRKLGK
jgi:anti-sigma28 factor (negative regulator of flagellin synthesis)